MKLVVLDTQGEKNKVASVGSEDSDSETSSMILDVSRVDQKSSAATIKASKMKLPVNAAPMHMVTDTGVCRRNAGELLYQKQTRALNLSSSQGVLSSGITTHDG